LSWGSLFLGMLIGGVLVLLEGQFNFIDQVFR